MTSRKARSRLPRVATSPITSDEVEAVIQTHISELVKCYERAADQEVALTITEAVSELASELLERQRGRRSYTHDHTQDHSHNHGQSQSRSHTRVTSISGSEPTQSPTPQPPSKKRRRSVDEDSDNIQTTNGDTDSTLSAPASKADRPVKEPPRPRKKRGSLSKRGSQGTSPQFPILAVVQPSVVQDIGASRQAFYDDLVKLQITMKHDGKDEIGTFSPDQAQELTDYIFDEIMGPACLDRLRDFQQAYAPATSEDEVDAGASARLRQIAHDKTAPTVIRRFCGTFSHHQDVNQKHPTIQHLQQIIQSRELYVHYSRVRDRIETGDEETIDFLRSKGLSASVGRGWSSVAIDFLAETVGLKRSAFINTCERAKGINQFVEQFGEGILPLLPPKALSKLRNFGNQRMGPAYELLKRHVQCIQAVCDWTKEYFYDPFVNGAHEIDVLLPSSRDLTQGVTERVSRQLMTPSTTVEVGGGD